MRYAVLVTERFPLHPSFRNPEYRQALKTVNEILPQVVHSMEKLKPRINKRYHAWERAEYETETVAHKNVKLLTTGNNEAASLSDPAIAGSTRTLGAAENKELAIKLARQEINRRGEERKTKLQRGITKRDELGKSEVGPLDDIEIRSIDDTQSFDDKTRKCMEEFRQLMTSSHRNKSDDSSELSSKLDTPKSPNAFDYRYPPVKKPQPLTYQHDYQREKRQTYPLTPHLPPKVNCKHVFPFQETPPPRPRKLSIPQPTSFPPPENNAPTFTFRPSSYLENGRPLRTVFLPIGLRKEFLKFAQPNTLRNLETCGMLCGTLISNALFIHCVVIPEQESTCDTCETINEGALFEYCDKEDLLVLGWIHTHPTQTCFMSSRDLHTHCGYQIMMPESIAIVCAPSKNPSSVILKLSIASSTNQSYSWGVFRLTDPPGLESILNCKKTGLFHPHAETNLYTDALRPGHVVEAEGMEFSVIDLRPR